MNTSYKSKTKTSTENHRSYFDWGCNMQVIRKGNGNIAMTESDLRCNMDETQPQTANVDEIFQPASR